MSSEGEERFNEAKQEQLSPLIHLTEEFRRLKDVYKNQGINEKDLYNEFIQHIRRPGTLKEVKTQTPKSKWTKLKYCIWLLFVPILMGFLGHSYLNEQSFLYGEGGLLYYIHDTKCLVDNSALTSEITRPLADCRMCKGLKNIPVMQDLSHAEFVQRFAYNSVPVLVKQATNGWTALDTFSFQYFKHLYTTTQDALEITEEECQFFPYDTEFMTLRDAFNMSDERAAFKPGERHWYFGWSNCQKDIAVELRKHYRKPHFLPPESESSALDWIFMGGPGRGAYIHMDSVQRPSWQAQISGRKTWTLIPPPECEDICRTMNATMEKGDIIVVDTNQWYHATYIHPGELSITIGSEYD